MKEYLPPITRCDYPGCGEEGCTEYLLTKNGVKYVVELCDDIHGKPLEDILTQAARQTLVTDRDMRRHDALIDPQLLRVLGKA